MLVDKAESKAEKLIFHVAPDAGPNDTIALLKTLYFNPDVRFTSLKQLCAVCTDMYQSAKHHFDAAKIAQLTDLVTQQGGRGDIRLTELGVRIATAAPELQADLLHYLLYTGWDEGQPERRGPLCTYREVCDILWWGEGGPVDVKHMLKGLRVRFDNLFAEVEEYQQMTRLSLSGKSVRGVTLWLERLSPPAFAEGCYAPRRSCPSALLLLAIGWAYRDALTALAVGRSAGITLTLDRAHREAICRLCLLEPAMLDHTLRAAAASHPQYLDPATLPRLRLLRFPNLRDDALLERPAA